MRTRHLILMLVVVGAVMAWQIRSLFAESLWYAIPMVSLVVFAAVFNHLLTRPGPSARRRALLFGVGGIALLASAVFAAFAWSFFRLLMHDSQSFDAIWVAGALGAGALAVWLWFRFYRILRQT